MREGAPPGSIITSATGLEDTLVHALLERFSNGDLENDSNNNKSYHLECEYFVTYDGAERPSDGAKHPRDKVIEVTPLDMSTE
jgi:hypothetical protein